jgi:hypothetical protein
LPKNQNLSRIKKITKTKTKPKPISNQKPKIMKVATDKILEQNLELRTKCLVYTRVMGYHRPVESFNIGKKGEHKQRIHFKENVC